MPSAWFPFSFLRGNARKVRSQPIRGQTLLRLEDGGWMDEISWEEVGETTVSLLLKLQAAVQDHLQAAVNFADEMMSQIEA